MIRAFLIAALTLTALFGLIVGGLRLQPRDDPAARYLVGCEMPCWNGITPGTTDREVADRKLSAIIGQPPLATACTIPLSSVCTRYTWQSAVQDSIPYAEMSTDHDQIQTLTVYTPRLTLGDALLTLRDLRVPLDSAAPGFETDGLFYTQLVFADAHLILRASAPCPGSFLDLMHTPINVVEVDSPRLDVQLGTATSFATLRAGFAGICS